MYEITKDGAVLSVEDKARYVKMQANGVLVLCPEEEAQGVVVKNDYACHLDGRPELEGTDTVSISEINGAARLEQVTVEGAALAQASTEEPPATVGVLAKGFQKWEPGAYYEKRYSLFEYGGDVGFTRQTGVTAQAHQPPFSTGMEAVYGIRPAPDDLGIYPYRYNMAAAEGMRVRDDEGVVWYCYNPIDPLLAPPGDVAAHFRLDDEGA